MKVLGILIVCGSLALPLVASAQSAADVDYCNKLAATYRGAAQLNSTPDATVPTAISKCATDPAGSIAVISKALTDAKVALPARM
jgi:hypothetical protein